MQRTRLAACAGFLFLVAALAAPLSVSYGRATGAGHAPPYDPKPLLEKAGPAGSGAYTFAVFGDSYAVPPLGGLLDMVARRAPALALTTGDMVARGGSSGTWRTLSGRAGAFLDRFPTWPVIGNHELAGGREAGLRAFEQFYGLSSPMYAFRFRNAKFIVLDHEAGPSPKVQLAFLRKELADRDQYQHVFVFRHVPFYTVGSKSKSEVPGTPTAMTKLFEQYHVTAVFSGHDHIYYRTKRGGVDYIISGSAGSPVYALQRLREAQPGDAYMGRDMSSSAHLLHSPTVSVNQADMAARGAPDPWLFAVFVQVDGAQVTAETRSARGLLWDRFTL